MDNITSPKQTKHDKNYAGPEEEAMRKEIFAAKLITIKEHNAKYEAGQESYNLKLNFFSDRTKEELNRMNGLRLPNQVG